MLPFVIGVNGPPEIGKSWFAHQAAAIIPYHCRIMSHSEFIRQEAFRQTDWTDMSPQGYAKFKVTEFYDYGTKCSITGRDLLIQIGNNGRAKDKHYWNRQITESPKFLHPEGQIVIIDTMGFFDELDWMQEHSAGYMGITIAPTEYSVGCLYRGDNRCCLPTRGGIRTFNSSRALEIFKDRLLNAQPYESASIDKRANWFSALMG